MIGTTITQLLMAAVLMFFAYKLWKKDQAPSINPADNQDETFRKVWTDIWEQVETKILTAVSDVKQANGLSQRVEALTKTLSELEIKKAQKDEEYGRKEREVEHKIGLERARQEQELSIQKSRLEVEYDKKVLELDKRSLVEERRQFTQQLKFSQDRFESEVKSQRELIIQLVGDVSRKISEKRTDSGSV